jgi:hypothetical protein
MTSLLLGLALIALAMVGVAVWRGLHLKRLAHEGVATTGRVLKIWSHTGASRVRIHRLRYQFDAADGRSFEGSVMITPRDKERLSEGAPVDVIYLPGDPKISALKSLVDQARQATSK